MVYYVNVYSYGMNFKVYKHHKNDWWSKCYADPEYIEYRIIVKMKDLSYGTLLEYNKPALVIRCVSGALYDVVEQVIKETKNTVIYSRPVYFIFNDKRMKITRNSTPESVRQEFWAI